MTSYPLDEVTDLRNFKKITLTPQSMAESLPLFSEIPQILNSSQSKINYQLIYLCSRSEEAHIPQTKRKRKGEIPKPYGMHPLQNLRM